MRVAFIISTMSSGGAERVASILCNYLARHDFEVNLVLLELPGTQSHYFIDKEVVIYQLGLINDSHTFVESINSTFRRVFSLRKTLSVIKPDIVISFMTETNILILFATSFKSWPLIISERVHPAFHNIGHIKSIFRNVMYRYADEIVVQTSGIAEWVKTNLGLNSVIIENPLQILDGQILEKKQMDNRKKIISAGRLENQKGFDLLIEAFSRLAKLHPDWDLYIYGEGSQKDYLNDLVTKHRLTNRIFLAGVSKDIHRELMCSNLFVLSSRYEGFPNILCEAMGCGVAVISTDCPDGPADIIENNINGLLVETDNIDALAHAIENLLNDENKRQVLADEGKNIIQRLDADKICVKWEDLINNLITSE